VAHLKEFAGPRGWRVEVLPHEQVAVSAATTSTATISRFYHAAAVVGLHGGAFSNIVFCHKRAVIVEINNNVKASVCASLLVRCSLFFLLSFVGSRLLLGHCGESGQPVRALSAGPRVLVSVVGPLCVTSARDASDHGAAGLPRQGALRAHQVRLGRSGRTKGGCSIARTRVRER
jgi:hypothetical protein